MVQAAKRIDVRLGFRPEEVQRPSTIHASDILVGGTNSAFPLPLHRCIERGKGAHVWDDAGREYIDFLLASGPLILGHAHPRVTEAIARQLSLGTAFHALNRPALELAARIVEVPGCAETVRFASTGTEATLHAVRLARATTGRERVMIFANSYHGSHDLSIVGHRGATAAQAGGVVRGTVENAIMARFNDFDSIESAFSDHGRALAAVLVEPQQRSLDPAPGFLHRLADLCRTYGTVLIFDEVLTGFRLAFGGAQEYYGVHPDLVCYGKIVGGGLPLSAISGRREIMARADPALSTEPTFVHVSGTLSGNPLCAVAGLATLRELEQPGVYERLHGLGGRLRAGLRQALEEHGVLGSVIGSGPIAAVNFADLEGRPGSARALRDEINRQLIASGILVQLWTRFYVSLLHTEDEIDSAVEAFDASLVQATARLAADPVPAV